jgi:hypothetical protein
MASNSSQATCAAGSGAIWFIGWLFTIGFAGLSFWQGVLGLIVWPYYLGLALT